MDLIYYPNPLLRKKNRDLTPDDGNLPEKIRQMFEIMYRNKGVGLAAPQVGWNVRLFIANPEGGGAEREKVFVNPRIVSSSGSVSEAEGCLSFPGLYITVNRGLEVDVEYRDADFKTHRETFNGFMARIVQHEYDHLEGILMIHRISQAEKVRNKRLLDELEERYAS
ncbi:MAG: peptide deformylase [bacterium]|nr:MAG: peptide deformylase [bacterium]